MKPTLIVLAAGIGSRYGGLKQIDRIGPKGEILIDYSLYDAMLAGFERMVIVIRKSIEDEFREVVANRFENLIDTVYVYQELTNVPSGYENLVNMNRNKPWGTGHAILVARDAVTDPFAVINADDFYGRSSFVILAEYLRKMSANDTSYCMVGFVLSNTLTEYGHVARGVCEVTPDGILQRVIERTHVEKYGSGARFLENGEWVQLTGNETVSMNLWGFTPTIFQHLELQFKEFLTTHGHDLKKEFFIPTVVDTLVQSGKASVNVLISSEQWFGVTYREDRPIVCEGVRALIKKGVYPEDLWAHGRPVAISK